MENRKCHIVIIDRDYNFLRAYEEGLIRKYSGAAEIQIITDPGYVDAYFSTPQDIDLLVIDEETYGDGAFLDEHTVGKIFLMTGEVRPESTYHDEVKVLLKNMPEEELFEQIDRVLLRVDTPASGLVEKTKKNTRVVAVYSPIGGCGKSLVCVALARKLKMLDQKVLLLGCDPTQSMSVYYPSEIHAGEELADKLKNPDDDTYWTILQNIGRDEVSYLLPFEKSLPSMNITHKEVEVLIRTLVSKQDFDFIILDIGTMLNRETSEDLNKIDSLILLTETNVIANKKMQKLLHDPELLPKCNCILVANEMHSDGMRLSRDSVFGTIAPYQSWEEALDDPVFYRIALKVTE
uniref:AAA family ATPase n=1 Tax=Eubacterium cellulosolvens TaxID=29322 RepID=UPI0004853094|nr:AAA family ATPase [[Eubacterium] cellulosolvens]